MSLILYPEKRWAPQMRRLLSPNFLDITFFANFFLLETVWPKKLFLSKIASLDKYFEVGFDEGFDL